jgi:hypothetical protein
MLLGHALVGFVGVLDAVLENFAFWRQKLSDLIDTGRGIATAIVHQLALWPRTLPSYGKQRNLSAYLAHSEHGPVPVPLPEYR